LNMRIPGAILILLAVFCSICVICGCLDTTAPSSVTESFDGGITPIDTSLQPQKYTLAEALTDSEFEQACGTDQSATICQVIGARVDPDGRATSWILGVRGGSTEKWLAFGSTGWKPLSLRAPLPEKPVLIAEIVSPESLLTPALMEHGVEEVDLVLAGGIYTVTVRSDEKLETFSFKADTGEVLVEV
jgi:hypothetical protein